jgi:hypothetical protein
MADRIRGFAFGAVILPFLFLAMSGVASALLPAVITVNTLSGEPAPGLCSLPDAIASHNAPGTPFNACALGSGMDIIVFTVTGQITVDETLEVTSGTLFIEGPITGGPAGPPPAAGIAISGGGSVQIIKADPGTSLTLANLTLANGAGVEGGAIFANGTDLEIFFCLFRDNTAEPTLIAGGMGGAIFGNSNGAITIVNSTFANNTAAHRGDPTVHNSGTDGFGGAIFYDTTSSVVKITNCTFSGNTADVATYDGFPAASIKGTIFANNTAILINPNCNGTPVDLNYNISDDASCGFSAPQSLNNTNPLLLALANNGGPTETFALETFPLTSPAIDRIPVASCTDQAGSPLETDQRLFARPDAFNPATCDSGAYEAFSVAPYTLNSERVQIARSTSPNSDQVNIGITFTSNGDPDCDVDEDALNAGIRLTLSGGTCSSMPATGLALSLNPFVVKTVNHQSYGTLFQTFGSETVSARMVALHTPAGTCGQWTLNLEVAGLNTGAIGLGGGNPFSLVLEDEQGEGANCFDITNAIVGNQIIVPGHSVRRGVRRQTRR